MNQTRATIAVRILLAVCAAGCALFPCARAGAQVPYAGKTILWVDSYEPGYAWSAGVERGIRGVLEKTGARLETIHLDANHADSREARREAGRAAYARLKELAPDVVIVSDDPAQEDLVVPFLRGGELPVVFCGVNWDAAMYGYPAKNVTGMLEVEAVDDMVRLMRRDARGPRIGYVSGETSTDAKISSLLNKRFFGGAMKTYFAEDFEEYKQLFDLAQRENDMLFLRNYVGIEGWDHDEARAFLARRTRLPTASPLDFMADFVVYAIGKVPEEQGEWAANAALRILDGASPADIPMAENQLAKLTVNLDMAKAAGIEPPLSLLKAATVLGQGREEAKRPE